jgi:hypothetical protein
MIYGLRASQPDWKNDLPTSLQITVLFSIFSIVVDFGMIFLNGIFPFFGSLYFGLSGIILIEANCAILAFIVLGTIKQSRIAWWLAVLYYTITLISLVLTAARNDYYDLLISLSLPPTEMAMLQDIPLKSTHFLTGTGIPLLAILTNLFLSRGGYGSKTQDAATANRWS